MRTKVAFALFGFLMLTNFLHGQGLGSIVGTVTDPSGAAVPSAQVKVTELGTGNSRMVSSDPQGYYVVTSLRPEQYTLSVQAAGFRTFTAKQVTLLADQNLTVNVKLDLGAANEIVEVTSNALQVNTADSTQKQVIEQQRITELPLNGRNAAELTLLVPGAVLIPAVENPTARARTRSATGWTAATTLTSTPTLISRFPFPMLCRNSAFRPATTARNTGRMPAAL